MTVKRRRRYRERVPRVVNLYLRHVYRQPPLYHNRRRAARNRVRRERVPVVLFADKTEKNTARDNPRTVRRKPRNFYVGDVAALT